MRIEAYLAEGAARFGAGAAVIGARGCHSYAELDLKSARLAAALSRRGVSRGDRVALFMDTGWEAIVSVFAVLKAGAAVNPIDPAARPEELRAALAESQPVAIVTEARLASTAAAAIAETASVKLAVLVGGDRAPATGTCLSFEDTVNRIGRPLQIDHAGEDTDLAAMFADAVAVTHRDVAAAAMATDVRGGAVPALSLFRPDGLPGLLAAIRAGAALRAQAPFASPLSLRPPVVEPSATDYPRSLVVLADSQAVNP